MHGQGGYITFAALGIPTASKWRAKSEVPHTWARWLHHPCRLGDPHRFTAGGKIRSRPTSGQGGYITPAALGIPIASKWGAKSEVAHTWARWLHHPCRLRDPRRCRAGGEISSRPTSGQRGYITPAASGIPTALERGTKSEVAHKWARWLHHPCCIGDPQRFKVGGKIRSGPYMGKVATSPVPSPGSPPLQSGGQNQKWAHQWARWLHHPCRLGDPHRFRAGGKIRSGPYMGKVGTSPLPPRGSPPL